MQVVACLKWVDRRPEIDPLTGRVSQDERSFGASPADQAALAWALRLASAWTAEVVAVTVGPAGAEAVLREALAVGATRAIRIWSDGVVVPGQSAEGAPASEQVAASLASVAGRADVVLCGDWSLDRGSGSVPSFLAAELGASQALGLVGIDVLAPGDLRVERRLDRGRREVLAVRSPAVVSVEGATAVLPRASLPATLAAARVPIELLPLAAVPSLAGAVRVERRGPYRPRPRVLPGPAGDDPRQRILHLVGGDRDRTPPRTLVADPMTAAAAIHDQLAAWGLLPPEAISGGLPTP